MTTNNTKFGSVYGWMTAGLYACLILAIYRNAFRWLVFHDWARDDYTHCAIIPLAVLYLIWEKRRVLASVASKPTWAGLLPLAAGICLFWLGELGGEFFMTYFSLWLVVLGVCLLHLGREKLKHIRFALFLILAMFPLPNFINSKMSMQLKLISSQLGVSMLQLWGTAAYREGNIIDIGIEKLQVVDACSGLRYLIPLMVLGLVVAYFFTKHNWKRAVVFISSVPLAIVVNGFRIAMTGILYNSIGPEAAEGFFHGFSGWLLFLMTVSVMFGEIMLLRKLPPRETMSEMARLRAPQPPAMPAPVAWKAILHPTFVVSVALLFATLALSQGIEFRRKIPMKKPFSSFPLQVSGWKGIRLSLDGEMLKEMNMNDYSLIDYKDQAGRQVNFYVAYYDNQQGGTSVHTPDTCLPGSGWIFRDSGKTMLPISADGTSIPAKRAVMEQGTTRELAYYWFPQRGRTLTSIFELKLFAFWDALIRQRTDGALVRLITPIYPNESSEESEKRVQEFAEAVVPLLKQYLPGN